MYKIRDLKKLVGIMSILLLFNVFSVYVFADLLADPLIGLILSPAIEGKTEYWTGEEFVVNLDIDMSSATESYPDAILEIAIPDEYMQIIQASDLEIQTHKEITSSEGITRIEYTLRQLTGGTTIRLPILLKSNNDIVPNGYSFLLETSLRDSEGTLIKGPEQLEIVLKTVAPKFHKMIKAVPYETYYDNKAVFGGISDPEDATILHSDLSNLSSVRFAYGLTLESRVAYPLGVRSYEKMVVKDYLPTGAYFDPALNPGWIYDETENTVTYTAVFESPFRVHTGVRKADNLYLYLKFPGGVLNHDYTNSAEIILTPYNMGDTEHEFELSDDITFRLHNIPPNYKYGKGAFNFKYLDQLSHKQTKTNPWQLSLWNDTSDTDFEELVIEDFDLDSRLKFVSIKVDNNMWRKADLFVGTFNIDITEDGSNWNTLAEDISASDRTMFNIPEETTRIRIYSTPGSYLKPGGKFMFYMMTGIRNPEEVGYTSGDVEANKFYNYMSTSASVKGIAGTTITNTSSNYASILPYLPAIWMDKSANKDHALLNDEVEYVLSIRARNTLSPDIIDWQQAIDLLPKGVEYIPGSVRRMVGGYLSQDEPIIVMDYEGTGRTALVWEFQKPLNLSSVTTDYRPFWLAYSVKVTENSYEGAKKNEAYLTWKNNGDGVPDQQQLIAAGNVRPDIYDFDKDGNSTEDVLYAFDSFTYIPPKEVIAQKSVKGSYNSSFIPTGGKTEKGGNADYKLEVYNNSLNDLDSLTIIEVLPYPGDRTIVADSSGEYYDRGSEYAVHLTGPVLAPAGYTIYYTNDLPIETANKVYDYVADADWVEVPSDYERVKGIKIVMNPEITLNAGDKAYFVLNTVADNDFTVGSGAIANNTFALSINTTDYLEVLLSSLEIDSSATEIWGHLYIDSNGNGSQDPGEADLANVDVIVTDSNGNKQTVTTDANGNYSAEVVAGEVITDIDETDQDYPTKFDQTEGTDPTLVVAIEGTSTFVENDGFHLGSSTGVWGHLYIDSNGNGSQDSGEADLANVDVIVTDSNGDKQTVTTDANGNYYAEVVAGEVITDIDETDQDYPINSVQTEGTDPTLVVAVKGTTTFVENDGFYPNPALGIIHGHLYIDSNGNGSQDPGETDLANVDVIVTDSNGDKQTVTTDANGNYTAEVVAGEVITDIDETDQDYPTNTVQTEGSDPTTITALKGERTFVENDGFYPDSEPDDSDDTDDTDDSDDSDDSDDTDDSDDSDDSDDTDDTDDTDDIDDTDDTDDIDNIDDTDEPENSEDQEESVEPEDSDEYFELDEPIVPGGSANPGESEQVENPKTGDRLNISWIFTIVFLFSSILVVKARFED